VYFLARDTVGGKAHWTREVGDVTYHLYAISVPHDGFAIGTDLRSPWGSVALSRCAAARAHPRYNRFANKFGTSISKATMRPNPRSHILECETYEDGPGWGTNTWKEECAANGGALREKQIGGSGGSLEPPGPLLEPPGPLLTHLHTVYMAYSECLPTRLNPLAERTCFSQADRPMPIAHLEKGALKLLGMIHKWGLRHQPPLAGAPASERGSQSEDSDSVAAADIGGLAAWELERVPIRPKRRLPYDILVPEAEYRTCYNRLKETYGKPWADNWPEKTDSQKFVFEEVGIAAYLCPRPPV
jgi:hypothetical protein